MPEIKGVVNYALAFVSGAAGGAMEALNIKLADTTRDEFTINLQDMLPLEGLPENDGKIPLNFSMSKYPEFNSALGEILLHVNGEFERTDMSSYVTEPTTWEDYTTEADVDTQLWIHQSMISSLLYDSQKTLSGKGFSDEIKLLFSELIDYYGADVSCDGLLTFPMDKENAEPITLTSAESGIRVGVDEKHGLFVNLDVFCAKDDTAEKEKSVTLELAAHLNLEFEFNDWIYHASISDPKIDNVVAKDSVFLMEYHNWDMELTYFLVDIADDFNLHY